MPGTRGNFRTTGNLPVMARLSLFVIERRPLHAHSCIAVAQHAVVNVLHAGGDGHTVGLGEQDSFKHGVFLNYEVKITSRSRGQRSIE